MKLNIFQKIAFLVYISIILLICVYFVPYHGAQNHLGAMMENFKSDSSYHSNILDEGFGSMSYLRFIIYFSVPGVFFYFIFRYLEKMNSLEINVYKKNAKREFYVYFVFIGVVIGTILYSYGNSEYSEIRKERLKSQISEINNSFDILREELSKRPPFVYEILKDDVDEYGIKIKKPAEKLNLDLRGYYYEAFLKNVDNVLKKTFNVRFSVIRKTQLDRNIKQLIYNESSSEDLNNMIIDYVGIFSDDGIKKTKLEFELKELNFYNVKFNVVFAFLGSFILLYIIRPLFSMFKGMLKEVR